MDWQKKLVMLDQELQFSQSVPLQSSVSKKPPNYGILFDQIEARTVEGSFSDFSESDVKWETLSCGHYILLLPFRVFQMTIIFFQGQKLNWSCRNLVI